MKKKVVIAYKIVYVLAVLMLLFSLLCLRIVVKQPGWQGGYVELNSIEQTILEDGEAPAGQLETYTYVIQGISGDFNTVFLHTIHQNVRVYLGEKCIFVLESTPGKLHWNSTGRVWNEITLSEEENAKKMRVEIRPAYQSAKNVCPTVYLGTRYDIIAHIIRNDEPAVLMSLFTIIVGLCYLGYGFYKHKKEIESDAVNQFGLFLFFIGLWKLTSTSINGFMADKYPVLSMVPHWSLLAVGIPYLVSVRYMLKEKESLVWDIPYLIVLVHNWGVLLLQCLGIADMRQTLKAVQGVLGAGVLFGLCMVIKNLIRKGWNKEIRLALFFCVSSIFWLASDIISYYITGGKKTSIVGMIGFVVYLCLVILDSARDARHLMTVGMQARQYEKIAFHDQLTGFYNRTAYAEYIGNEEFSPQQCIIAMFDLNNLKKCNDTLGHEKGDIYIRESARIIRECFGDIGQCYRVGGDEFTVIINGSSKDVCAKRLEELLNKVKNFNKRSKDIHMGIACGYEQFDEALDQDIEDTGKRADQMMYQHKFKLKQEMAESNAGLGEKNV